MNNDSPPNPSVPSEDGNTIAGPSEDATEGGTDTDSIQLSKKQLQSAKKDEALDDLIHSLDIIIYCELSILYYMEYTITSPCSLIRLLTIVEVILSFNLSSVPSLNSFTLHQSLPHSLHRQPIDLIFSFSSSQISSAFSLMFCLTHPRLARQ